jgi:hypothetical protein
LKRRWALEKSELLDLRCDQEIRPHQIEVMCLDLVLSSSVEKGYRLHLASFG